MKSRRSDRRRSDDSNHAQSSSRTPATPTMDGPRPDMPSEFIDLSTESFRDAFPDLARRKPGTQRPPAPDRRKDRDKG